MSLAVEIAVGDIFNWNLENFKIIETKVSYEIKKQKSYEGCIRLLQLHKPVRFLQFHHAVFYKVM